MKKDIVFAGVGGQGIVSASSMLVEAAGLIGLNIKQNEVHGMAQRGGSVVCHVRISDGEIFSNIIPKGSADFIFATEPMEAIRYADYLSADGTMITTDSAVKNIPDYPDPAKILGHIKSTYKSVVIGKDEFMADVKNAKALNTAVMGALIKALGIPKLEETLAQMLAKRFKSKGEALVELNLKALEFGKKAAS